jgi:hypothetical protein
MKINYAENEVWPLEGDITAVAGASLYITCTFLDASAIAAGATCAKVYLGNEDVTAAKMAGADSHVVSDNSVTLKVISSLVAGNDYVVAVTVTLDGSDIVVKKFKIAVDDAGTL